jgi:hypothetical protein
MKPPTTVTYERKASVNTKPRQSIQFCTTPHKHRAGTNWHKQWEDRSDHGQKEKTEKLIGNINNFRAWQEKEIHMAEEENAHWTSLNDWAAG